LERIEVEKEDRSISEEDVSRVLKGSFKSHEFPHTLSLTPLAAK
jgi:hypothetical protein